MLHGLLWLPLLFIFILLTALGWLERRRQNLFRSWANGSELCKLDSSGAASLKNGELKWSAFEAGTFEEKDSFIIKNERPYLYVTPNRHRHCATRKNVDENPEKKETIIYKNGVIEESFFIPKTKRYYEDIIDQISDRENISIKRVSNQREENVFSNRKIEENLSPEQFLLKVGKISKSKEDLFESANNDNSKRNPIEERIGDINKFEKIIERNLERNQERNLKKSLYKRFISSHSSHKSK